MNGKEYTVIIKVGHEKFIKYRKVKRFRSLRNYLDEKFPSWRYINVYCRNTKTLVGSFTKNNPPVRQYYNDTNLPLPYGK